MLNNEIRKSKTVLILFCFLILIIIFISTLTVRNAIHLRTSTEALTFSYLDDVSYQVSEHIDHRISEIILNLHSIADSLAHVDTQESRLITWDARPATMVLTRYLPWRRTALSSRVKGNTKIRKKSFPRLHRWTGSPISISWTDKISCTPFRFGKGTVFRNHRLYPGKKTDAGSYPKQQLRRERSFLHHRRIWKGCHLPA